ncbi:hypothetical protein PIB30_059427 [Stylosanthes scabra]|uniref:Uncharacterized protein n=1 Tax=Stylosanthes scabra TaxID=79078 RepID=A0ABU6SLN0_9FABA|nr:hypothetical protein [Stylosanthes scabra]
MPTQEDSVTRLGPVQSIRFDLGWLHLSYFLSRNFLSAYAQPLFAGDGQSDTVQPSRILSFSFRRSSVTASQPSLHLRCYVCLLSLSLEGANHNRPHSSFLLPGVFFFSSKGLVVLPFAPFFAPQKTNSIR